MEMPASLKTLPPEALEILRQYGRTGQIAAYSDDIISGSGLSDRAFGKGVRRLVTRSYVMMDGSQQYRLTENGRRLLADLLEYDLDPDADEPTSAPSPARPRPPLPPRFVRRRALLVLPDSLVAGQGTNIYVGFDPAEDGERVDLPMRVLVRVSMAHGEPASAAESALLLENRELTQTFEITAGQYTTARVRVEVCQDGADTDGCGGLYVDLPVSAANDDAHTALIAFGSDLMLLDAASGGAAYDDERARLLDELDF